MDGGRQDIVARKGPVFDWAKVPKYWFGGDAFKTRFFDAMSLVFPEGERFFIACVRDFREQIQDPQLQAQVKEFIYQEGQHGMVHTAFNDHIASQGIAVEHIVAEQHRIMFGIFRKRLSKGYTLGQTAAAEHLTALMAHGFFGTGLFADADPQVRAMYAWHAVEEIEHKAVAYDVMQKVAKVGYFTRILSMLQVSITFPLHVFLIMRHMFKVDGVQNRTRVWLKGLWWLYGPGGVYPRLMPHYLRYFKPGFHPWQHGEMDEYQTWRQVYESSGRNAIVAADAVMAAS